MKIGKIIKIIKRPDVIPARIPKTKTIPILVPNWPAKRPEPAIK